MKATNIKWDTDEAMEVFESLPAEVEIPDNLLKGYDGTNFDTYYPDISDWLSDITGFCHYGFEIEYDKKDVKSYLTSRDVLEAFDLSGVEITDEDIDRVLTEANKCGELLSVANKYLQGIRDCLDEGLEELENE